MNDTMIRTRPQALFCKWLCFRHTLGYCRNGLQGSETVGLVLGIAPGHEDGDCFAKRLDITLGRFDDTGNVVNR